MSNAQTDPVAAELAAEQAHVDLVYARLDEATSRCRSAVAVALGVKPWAVRARPRTGGGFDLELPESYSPSRHDKKLAEVATSVVGRDGWYVDVDPRNADRVHHPR